MICPNCKGPVIYYHGDGVTRIVCKNKCQGWKIIKEIDRKQGKSKCQESEKNT